MVIQANLMLHHVHMVGHMVVIMVDPTQAIMVAHMVDMDNIKDMDADGNKTKSRIKQKND